MGIRKKGHCHAILDAVKSTGENSKAGLPEGNESPHSKLWGICGANSRIFVARIRFAAPRDAACHPTLRFIPAASCGAFSLDFGKRGKRGLACTGGTI